MMRLFPFIILMVAAAGPAFAHELFHCEPTGSNRHFEVWTESASATKEIITVRVLGRNGIEGVEKYSAQYLSANNEITFSANDVVLTVDMEMCDSAHYATLSVHREGTVQTQELSCREYRIPN